MHLASMVGNSMLGTTTSTPFYISATALGKLGHKEGELELTRTAGRQNKFR